MEIRFHGRGGQGAVIASWIAAYSFFLEGKHAQAFPTFGAERRGAPVEAFVRVDDSFINLRCKVIRPQHVIVLNEHLIKSIDVLSGIQENGTLLINSNRQPQEFRFPKDRVFINTLDVNSIALKNGLGSITNPFINTSILGAFAGFTNLLRVESLIPAIGKFITAQLEKNLKAFHEAFSIAREIAVKANRTIGEESGKREE